MAKAKGVKSKMQEVITAAYDLLSAINSDKEWAWAQGEALSGPLRTARAKLDVVKPKNGSVFWKNWLLEGNWASSIKKSYMVPNILAERKHLDEINLAVKELEDQIDTLRKMQAARPAMH